MKDTALNNYQVENNIYPGSPVYPQIILTKFKTPQAIWCLNVIDSNAIWSKQQATNSNQHIFFKVINHEYSTEDHSYIPTVNKVILTLTLNTLNRLKKLINQIKILSLVLVVINYIQIHVIIILSPIWCKNITRFFPSLMRRAQLLQYTEVCDF